MAERKSHTLGERFVYGSCGAFLAALIAMSVQFWFWNINWWVVGVFAIFGFVLAWFLGEDAIDFLKEVLWRT